MKSRLNQLNTSLAFHFGAGLCALTLVTRQAALGYRVPSSPMPRTALQQPHRRQPPAPQQPVLRQRLDCVLATGRTEPARRQSHRRDGVTVELDQKNEP